MNETVKDKPNVITEPTNKEFAVQNEAFKDACEKSKVDPTSRQASKWRSKKGKAWDYIQQVRRITLDDSTI